MDKFTFLRSWAQERRQTAGDSEGFADFVISFRRGKSTEDAQEALEDVVKRLVGAGLVVEVRAALRAQRGGGFEVEAGRVLLFVTCPRARLEHEMQRSRVQDWLGGMVALRRGDDGALEVDAEVQEDPRRLLEGQDAGQLAVAERQRLVRRIISGARSEGGAEVAGDGMDVVGLHDRKFNQQWLGHWARTWLIDGKGLRRIREHFGDEIAMYFAFLQSYVLWLALPAVVGIVWWGAGERFSWQFGALQVLWGVVFTETWARREADIATSWGVRGVQHARDTRRTAFRPDRYVTDAATGERVATFSAARRWVRRLAGVPVIAALALAMAALIGLIFGLQTFVSEFYAGPFGGILGLVPVVLFSASLPGLTALCTRVAAALTEYENYEYEAEHAAQLTAKIFVFRFLQDQLYLFLTAWVFVPHRDAFGTWINGAYDALRGVLPLAPAHTGLKASATPAAQLVQSMLTSFVVTSQLVNMATETALPLLQRWWGTRAGAGGSGANSSDSSSPSSSNSGADGPGASNPGARRHMLASVLAVAPTAVDTWVESDSSADAPPDIQQQFIARVAEETALPAYTTFEDYAEMASQFARVAFFSVAWPLAPLAALLNNWLELRTDAAKICSATQRPPSRRVESIGPWLHALRMMCWLSSITNALLVYQFHPNCALLPHADPEALRHVGRTRLSFALVVLLFSEHAFLAVRWLVVHVMASWPAAHVRIAERARAQSRRRWLDRAPPVLRGLAADSDELHAESPADWRAELERGRDILAGKAKTA
ncbi:hypothetical protein IWW36_003964 [Coemansia brasiliensis]|uniref:Uncharacterized protein n=1 Tax=Coemansia brasiliensis TaxID=2650707 RepID=A0A9W8IBQ1_9FUNG|nr:hypothetical protein IWW36_003964 [Coemansia brasiliensis]